MGTLLAMWEYRSKECPRFRILSNGHIFKIQEKNWLGIYKEYVEHWWRQDSRDTWLSYDAASQVIEGIYAREKQRERECKQYRLEKIEHQKKYGGPFKIVKNENKI